MQEKVPKSYRFRRDSVNKLEEIRASIEKKLGMKVSTTAAIEILIKKYHDEYINK